MPKRQSPEKEEDFMKGKKFLALLMAGAMTLSFAACGNNDDSGSSSPTGGGRSGKRTAGFNIAEQYAVC